MKYFQKKRPDFLPVVVLLDVMQSIYKIKILINFQFAKFRSVCVLDYTIYLFFLT